MFRITSNDNKVFNIDKQALYLSKKMKEANSDDIKVDVSAEVLEVVAKYLNYHATKKPERIPLPAPNDLSEAVDKWDAEYIDQLTPSQCNFLLTVANSLGIKDLKRLAAAKIAVTLRYKDLKTAKKLMNVKTSTKGAPPFSVDALLKAGLTPTDWDFHSVP